MSFERLEALRYADSLAKTGVALINRQIITPVSVSSGQQAWVEDIDERVERAFPKRRVIDALSMAREIGSIRTVNIIMTGALSCLTDIPQNAWEQAVVELVPVRHKDVNIKAFSVGRGVMTERQVC